MNKAYSEDNTSTSRADSSQVDAGHALERLLELAVLLNESMDHGLAEGGLTRARAELIWRLGQQGSMTQRELSEALRCTPRNVTGLVDALEEDGFVARRPHPTDRRATLVELTERGSNATEGWRAGYRDLAALLFADLEASELSSFVAALDRVLERLRGVAAAAADEQSGR
jgi:DNA-binding MarR family transcriptional regulator